MLKAIDFFSGCGGTSAGLRRAGVEIIAGVDCDPDAGRTFRKNFPEARFFETDIRLLQSYDFDMLLERPRTSPLLISACAPCQPFTKQKTTKRKVDERVDLLSELHRFVRALRPEYIFVENVPGLQKVSEKCGPLHSFKELLKEMGYQYDYKAPQSAEYGVPQIRRRLVLVASSVGDLKLPAPTHGPETEHKEFENVWDWIGDLPEITAGSEHLGVPNHRAAALSDLNLKRISATPPGGGRLDWPANLRLPCHEGHSGHTDVYGRLHKDKPSAALSTRCVSLSNGRYGHPTQNRAISVREAARLQTFDDEFIFEGNLNSMARQIGNAVPVRLAEVFGRHLTEHYKASKCSEEVVE